MATVSTPSPAIVAWLLVLGGVLQVVAALTSYANVSNPAAIYAVSNVAMGMAFVLLLVWWAKTTVARIAFLISGAGWLLLSVTSVIDLGFVGTLAFYVAIVGSVFAAVMVLITRTFGRVTDIVFAVAMSVGTFVLLVVQNSVVPVIVDTVGVVVFGVLHVASGAGILILPRATPADGSTGRDSVE
jgi:hypothetical protein